MDDFFNKYGWIVVSGILIVIAIMFAQVFGQAVCDSIEAFVEAFATHVENAIATLSVPSIS